MPLETKNVPKNITLNQQVLVKDAGKKHLGIITEITKDGLLWIKVKFSETNFQDVIR